MINAPLRILIVAGLCVLSLIALVVRESMARESETEVLLAMEAIDPRSVLSGHYVIVDVREQLAPNAPCPEVYDAEWIALTPADGHHSFAGAAPSRDAALQIAPVAVRGLFQCTDPTPPDGDFAGTPGWVALNLGINRFHIEQAEAQRIERVLRDQNVGEGARVFAIVSVGQDGRARLKGLMVDGERLELGWH
jgi:GDYXXLXY protein